VSFDSLPEPATDDATGTVIPRPVRDAIDALPERLKRVLLLSEVAGMSYREIAEITGVEEGTVGSRRNRALEIVRRRLAPARMGTK
jgi:RNA polymerase sigma-70 factor (ECF subfamily)